METSIYIYIYIYRVCVDTHQRHVWCDQPNAMFTNHPQVTIWWGGFKHSHGSCLWPGFPRFHDFSDIFLRFANYLSFFLMSFLFLSCISLGFLDYMTFQHDMGVRAPLSIFFWVFSFQLYHVMSPVFRFMGYILDYWRDTVLYEWLYPHYNFS